MSAQPEPDQKFPRIVCLCGSTRFYDQFQQANYDLTMQGVIVLSVGFYPHAKAQHGHGEGVGHDSTEKVALDELHKRKIDLADEVLVVSDETGYFGESTAGEIAYAVEHGKPVRFAVDAARERALGAGLVREAAVSGDGGMTALPDDWTPPPRSIIGVEWVPGEQGGGVLVGCDCGTTTHLMVDDDMGGLAEPREAAFTCGGCQSVHWFTVYPPAEGGAPS